MRLVGTFERPFSIELSSEHLPCMDISGIEKKIIKSKKIFKFASEIGGGTKNVGVVIVVPFFFIHLFLFQPNSQDSTQPLTSRRSELQETFFFRGNIIWSNSVQYFILLRFHFRYGHRVV